MNASEDAVTYCARHPNVETVLRCGRCDTPICPRCLVQTPVGARCPTCANVHRLPTIDVSPVFLIRGLVAAIISGLVVGTAWAYISRGTGLAGFFIFFIGIGIGYAVGESVSAATNRKRSSSLQVCAALGVVLAYFTRNIVLGAPLLPAGDLWGYIAAVVAAYYATTRLKA